MRLPRWWGVAVAEWLTDLDVKWLDAARSGPLVLEIHYRSGAPLLVKVREQSLPPPTMEFRLNAATS